MPLSAAVREDLHLFDDAPETGGTRRSPRIRVSGPLPRDLWGPGRSWDAPGCRRPIRLQVVRDPQEPENRFRFVKSPTPLNIAISAGESCCDRQELLDGGRKHGPGVKLVRSVAFGANEAAWLRSRARRFIKFRLREFLCHQRGRVGRVQMRRSKWRKIGLCQSL